MALSKYYGIHSIGFPTIDSIEYGTVRPAVTIALYNKREFYCNFIFNLLNVSPYIFNNSIPFVCFQTPNADKSYAKSLFSYLGFTSFRPYYNISKEPFKDMT